MHRQGSEPAKDLGPLWVPDDDEDLLEAVVDHYGARLWQREDAEELLARVGASAELARGLSIGLCDRTLGLRLPDRQLRAGADARDRLTAMGVLRGTGHEALRGCVVVPVRDGSGTVVALYGRPMRTGAERFASGLPGGLFGRAIADGGGPMVVTGSVPEALAVLSAGFKQTVAPGRPGGYGKADVRQLAIAQRPMVVSGSVPGSVKDALEAHGASVSVLAGGDLGVLLRSAEKPEEALRALLGGAEADAVEDEAPAASSGTAMIECSVPICSGSLLRLEPDAEADAIYLHGEGRSWRVRGSKAAACAGGLALKVAVSVTDSTSGHMHLDVLDLYVARQRAGFLEAAAKELRVDADRLGAELALVVVSAETQRDQAGAAVSEPVLLEDAEREEAMALLCSSDLLAQVHLGLCAQGVVGEETNLLLCYLATISRLCERPFGVVVQSSSAAGKSTLADAVCALVPEEDLVSLSALTGQALYYLGPKALERKVLYVAEEHGASRAAYALKLLLSEGRLAIASTTKDRGGCRLRATRPADRSPSCSPPRQLRSTPSSRTAWWCSGWTRTSPRPARSWPPSAVPRASRDSSNAGGPRRRGLFTETPSACSSPIRS